MRRACGRQWTPVFAKLIRPSDYRKREGSRSDAARHGPFVPRMILQVGRIIVVWKLHRNFNYIRVRRFILGGAPLLKNWERQNPPFLRLRRRRVYRPRDQLRRDGKVRWLS